MKVRFGSSFPDPTHWFIWTDAEEDMIRPTFIQKLSNMQQIMGSLVTLECRVEGSPLLSVE